MYQFQAVLHPRGPDVVEGECISLGSEKVRTLVGGPSIHEATFPISYETAAAALEKLPRLDIEPDGWFVWPSSSDEPRWQLEGTLHDRHDRLLFVHLKGTCPAESFDQFLTALGWPRTPLLFQLVREAVFLSEEEFRRVADGGLAPEA
ncbi:MAG: hypothetical protein IID44_28450 [Planctomycetes bacterium]|nr:hypothetical protein [Planctomycetota bacterium]